MNWGTLISCPDSNQAFFIALVTLLPWTASSASLTLHTTWSGRETPNNSSPYLLIVTSVPSSKNKPSCYILDFGISIVSYVSLSMNT